MDKKRGVCDTLMPQINRLLENLPNFKNIKSLSTTHSAYFWFTVITLIFTLLRRGSKSNSDPSDPSAERVNALKSLSEIYKICLPQNQQYIWILAGGKPHFCEVISYLSLYWLQGGWRMKVTKSATENIGETGLYLIFFHVFQLRQRKFWHRKMIFS